MKLNVQTSDAEPTPEETDPSAEAATDNKVAQEEDAHDQAVD